MSIYLVHVPEKGDDRLKAAARAKFVREGFRWSAFIFGPLWLLWNRLWLELFFYIVGAGLLFVGVEFWGLSEEAAGWIGFFVSALIGFEASGMVEGRLERGRSPLVDVVAGGNKDDIERRFFARWIGAGASSPEMGSQR